MNLLNEIKNDDLHIWSAEINAHELKYKQFFSSLDDEELEVANNIKNANTHKMFVISHGWLRLVLSRYLDCTENQLIFKKTIYGKPYLTNQSKLSFNLSHSSDKILLAVAWNCLLGADVEEHILRPELKEIAETCLSINEFIYWSELPEKLKNIIFYKLWTRKEAFFKATGKGITMDMKSCEIKPKQLNSFVNLPREYYPATDWHITELNIWPKASTVIVSNKLFQNVKLLT